MGLGQRILLAARLCPGGRASLGWDLRSTTHPHLSHRADGDQCDQDDAGCDLASGFIPNCAHHFYEPRLTRRVILVAQPERIFGVPRATAKRLENLLGPIKVMNQQNENHHGTSTN